MSHYVYYYKPKPVKKISEIKSAVNPNVKSDIKSEIKPELEKIEKSEREIADVKEIMTENIGKMLQNCENLEDLEEKVERVSENSELFKDGISSLRKIFWWKKYQIPIALGTGITVSSIATALIFFL